MEHEQRDSYLIPPNFIESGTLLGGMFKTRTLTQPNPAKSSGAGLHLRLQREPDFLSPQRKRTLHNLLAFHPYISPFCSPKSLDLYTPFRYCVA